MLKRIVGLVVGTTVACTSFMAFAAEVDTTSTYVSGTDKISVESRVTGVSKNQTLTYLAYKGVEDLADLKGTNIVYIDQVTLASDMEDFDEPTSTYTFKYTADTTDIQSNVKIGGDAGTNTKPDAIAGPACTVTFGQSEKDVLYEDIAQEGFQIFECDTDGEVVDVEVDDERVADGKWYVGINTIAVANELFRGKSSARLEVTKNIVEEAIKTTGIASLVSENKNSVIVVGVVKGNSSDYGAYIKIGDDKEIKYPAIAKGSDGRYAIKLEGVPADADVVAYTYVGDVRGEEARVSIGTESAAGQIIKK